jgi:ethanolamine ammonia-lyase small subunit
VSDAIHDSTFDSNTNNTTHNDHGGVVDNPWRRLREFTDARIGLGRTGISLPTAELLAFQLAHAQAKDAVHLVLDKKNLLEQLHTIPALDFSHAPFLLHSRAPDRFTYLQRPDLGRQLDEPSRAQLARNNSAATPDDNITSPTPAYDLALVIVDGLSALAVQQNAAPFIDALCAELAQDAQPWKLAPLCIVEQGRVAIGDETGELLNAHCVLVMIGERPGLSSPDSLGLYLTWAPHKGLTDAARNCVSNIRPAGLVYREAAKKAAYLLREAKRLGLSGVGLKDRTEDSLIEQHNEVRNFLLS